MVQQFQLCFPVRGGSLRLFGSTAVHCKQSSAAPKRGRCEAALAVLKEDINTMMQGLKFLAMPGANLRKWNHQII